MLASVVSVTTDIILAFASISDCIKFLYPFPYIPFWTSLAILSILSLINYIIDITKNVYSFPSEKYLTPIKELDESNWWGKAATTIRKG